MDVHRGSKAGGAEGVFQELRTKKIETVPAGTVLYSTHVPVQYIIYGIIYSSYDIYTTKLNFLKYSQLVTQALDWLDSRES